MRVLLVLLLCACCGSTQAHAASYAVARSYTPVLNTPAFSSVFGGADRKTLKTDRCGQVRELEFIALPDTVFKIIEELRDGAAIIYRVSTDDYAAPARTSLYVDGRFVELRETKPPPRTGRVPSRQAVVGSLKDAVGAPYVWGGNVQGGIGELIEIFYGGQVPEDAGKRLKLAGLDCSGLLYQATEGWTPRNTAQLVSYGKPVSIAGKTAAAILKVLEPLDLIAWNGHVIIVLDQETVIESRLECAAKGSGGVMMTGLQKRLSEIMRTRRPVDNWPVAGKQRDVFVVRRWF